MAARNPVRLERADASGQIAQVLARICAYRGRPGVQGWFPSQEELSGYSPPCSSCWDSFSSSRRPCTTRCSFCPARDSSSAPGLDGDIVRGLSVKQINVVTTRGMHVGLTYHPTSEGAQSWFRSFRRALTGSDEVLGYNFGQSPEALAQLLRDWQIASVSGQSPQ